MNDQEFAAFQEKLDRIGRDYNTPELALKHLQDMGFLDEKGEFTEPYRDTECP